MLLNIPGSRHWPCDFCDEFSGGTANAYTARFGTSSRRLLHFGALRVLPSLGQLTEGHLLVVPVPHYCAVADLPDELLIRLEELKGHIRTTLKSTYGECVFFEHGIRGTQSGGCGISHAHLHAVPAKADRVLEHLRDKFQGSAIQKLREVTTKIPRESPYLFFENSIHEQYVFPVKNVPSQFLRQLVGKEIGNYQWDWRKKRYEPEIGLALQRISPLLAYLADLGG
ncbi:MAG TPA: hypothetical protein VGU90_04045 [Terriglobales bacterium]|nr:hypothetical protein [Terriglobales bacterium]